MAEEKKQSVTVYSYRKVWFVEKKIYAFQNIVLPFPIAPYEVLEFLAVVGAMLVMGRIFPILNNIPVVLRYGMLPYVTVKYLMKVKLDGKKIEKGYVNEIIDTLSIRTKLENLPSALSGGQQQRVAIARALAAKPAILLADEPTGNLDSKTSQDVLGLLKVTGKRFHQTIVMITHNEEIAQMADRILQIEDGKIVSDSGLV